MRLTGGQYLSAIVRCPAGRRGARRGGAEYGRVQASSATSSAGCGAWRSGLSSTGPLPSLDGRISLADRDHGVAEPVELGEVLALGGLDHQRAGDRERHRRRVEAEVDESLGDVLGRDAGGRGDRTQVEDALVGDEAARARCRAPGSAATAAGRRSWR